LFLPICAVKLNGRWFASTTSQAVLRFDYVSTNKPRKGTPCLLEKRFEKLVSSLNLEQLKIVWDKMSYNKEVCALIFQFSRMLLICLRTTLDLFRRTTA